MLDKKLRVLKSRIAETKIDTRGHRRFDAKLRDELLMWWLERTQEGATPANAARELGINTGVLARWRYEGRPETREVVVELERHVELRQPAIPVARGGELRILLRSGVAILGLELAEAIEIARALK